MGRTLTFSPPIDPLSQLGLGFDPVHDPESGQPPDLMPEPIESVQGNGH